MSILGCAWTGRAFCRLCFLSSSSPRPPPSSAPFYAWTGRRDAGSGDPALSSCLRGGVDKAGFFSQVWKILVCSLLHRSAGKRGPGVGVPAGPGEAERQRGLGLH